MAEEMKEQIKIYGGTGLAGKVALFNNKAAQHVDKQLTNPFSNWDGASHSTRLSKDDVNYGRPVQGSKTEYRGKKAGALISSEVRTLCDMIWEFGERDSDGRSWITFGQLFEIYNHISNKVVGLLLRARKQGLLDFKGEMLFQRRDDDVVIGLVHPISEIRKMCDGKNEKDE